MIKYKIRKERPEGGGGDRLSGILTNLESLIDPKIGGNKNNFLS